MNKVNGQKVENLKITTLPNGTYEITYDEPFHLIKSHISKAMARLREKNLKATIIKDLQHNLIVIFPQDINDAELITSILEIQKTSYEINTEEEIIIIHTRNGEYHKLIKGGRK